jgi:Tfp pilus assembly PilM family ATPase
MKVGTAQMEQEIQKRVITLTKQNQESLVEESGIQPSLTEEGMKSYLQQVIKEIQKSRQQK